MTVVSWPTRLEAIRTTLLAAAVVLLLIILTVTTLHAYTTTHEKWEYTITTPPDREIAARMSELGDAGWELVAARRAVTAGEPAYEMIFKRRKQ